MSPPPRSVRIGPGEAPRRRSTAICGVPVGPRPPNHNGARLGAVEGRRGDDRGALPPPPDLVVTGTHPPRLVTVPTAGDLAEPDEGHDSTALTSTSTPGGRSVAK